MPVLPLVDSNELESVKDALNADITDAGVGVLHLSTNRVYLRPISLTRPPGHTALVRHLNFNQLDCRGFAIVKNAAGQFLVENVSGLNLNSGGATNFQMPQTLFDDNKQALLAAGL